MPKAYWHRPTMDDELGRVPWWAVALASVVLVVGGGWYWVKERIRGL